MTILDARLGSGAWRAMQGLASIIANSLRMIALWHWLNQNSPAVQAVATVGSLLAVIVMGFLSAHYARRTIAEMQAQRSLSVRPRLEWEGHASTAAADLQLVIDLTNRAHYNTRQATFFWEVRNVGAARAFDVCFDLPHCTGGHPQTFATPIVVAPEATITVAVTTQQLISDPHNFTVALHYADLNNAEYRLDLHVNARTQPPTVKTSHHKVPMP